MDEKDRKIESLNLENRNLMKLLRESEETLLRVRAERNTWSSAFGALCQALSPRDCCS